MTTIVFSVINTWGPISGKAPLSSLLSAPKGCLLGFACLFWGRLWIVMHGR